MASLYYSVPLGAGKGGHAGNLKTIGMRSLDGKNFMLINLKLSKEPTFTCALTTLYSNHYSGSQWPPAKVVVTFYNLEQMHFTKPLYQ